MVNSGYLSIKNGLGIKKGDPEGNLIIFKPGYGKFPGSDGTDAVGVSDTWPPADKYIVYELPELKTRKEKSRNAFDTKIDYDLQFNKQKLLINAVNEEFKNLGLLDRYINKEGKPFLILEEKTK